VKHPAIKELYNIIKVEDWTNFCPEKNRQALLDEWIEKWMIQVEQSQSVVNPKLLDSEHSDFIKYRMGQILGEALTEECVSFETDKKQIKARMVGLKRGK
jgi:hypothetical protein